MDRGIKKWAPFKALEQQEDYLSSVFNKRHLEKETELMDDSIDQINDILTNHNNEKLTIIYFDMTLKNTTGYITKTDISAQNILINGITIPFSKIKNINVTD